MNKTLRSLRACIVIVLFCSLVVAQSTNSTQSPVVPQLVNFSGKAVDIRGKPITGVVGITFSIYNAQEDGAPLWMETQNVQPDGNGNYTVQLGATKSEGLPLDLFRSGEARWLGVRVNGAEQLPRVMLLSVPYALKAGDAQTVGGLPASAFVLALPSASSPQSPAEPVSPAQGLAPAVGGGGLENYIPIWADENDDLGNSILYQLGSGSSAKIGINITKPLFLLDVNGQELVRGLFEMATTNYANKNKGFDSNPLNFESSAFNSGTSTYTLNHFQWQAEPTGNNTTTPGATLNLLYGTDPNQPAETGLNIASSGQITFATGQTFPGTITGITTASGSGLSGGGTTGNLNLSLVNTCAANQVLQWNGSAWACSSAGTGTITGVTAGTDLTGGGTNGNVTLNVDTTKVPQLATANTFTGNQTVNGNLSATGPVSAASFEIGSNLFDYGSYANANAFLGFAGPGNNFHGVLGPNNTAIGYQALIIGGSGFNNTATGYQALYSTNTGYGNTASGVNALLSNNSGAFNSAGGQSALYFNTTGNSNTGYGHYSGFTADSSSVTGSGNTFLGDSASMSTGTLTNAAAIGANALVSESNALVLGSIAGVNGAAASTNIGIGTSSPQAVLDVETGDQESAGWFENDNATFIQTLVAYNDATLTQNAASFITGSPYPYPKGGACEVDTYGNLSCTGMKSAVVPVDGGSRMVALYAVEAPENWFEDFGSGQLSKGSARIDLEPTFAQTVNTDLDYHVFLTPNDECEGLYVTHKTATSFEVRELHKGKSNVTFDYRIIAKRKNYENVRLADLTERYKKLAEQQARMQQRKHKPAAIPAAANSATALGERPGISPMEEKQARPIQPAALTHGSTK